MFTCREDTDRFLTFLTPGTEVVCEAIYLHDQGSSHGVEGPLHPGLSIFHKFLEKAAVTQLGTGTFTLSYRFGQEGIYVAIGGICIILWLSSSKGSSPLACDSEHPVGQASSLMKAVCNRTKALSRELRGRYARAQEPRLQLVVDR
jgi:hypothetical protein